ncbi:MAG: flagellar basal body protein FliL [Alphaproteobacteria bacterium]|nr:MAG: flagellar basal body protein FliL [Alphaproteobacteria bacterium]
MADEAELESIDETLDEAPARKRLSGKKIVLFAAPVLLLLLGGGAYFMGLFGGKAEEAQVAEGKPAEPVEVIFYEVPEMLVNLNTGERKASYLKIRVALEVDRQSAAIELEQKLPRVIDNFQIYLRELRIEDLSGSAGMFRLKEELLRRVNLAVAPTEVKDVLFKEMLVQ